MGIGSINVTTVQLMFRDLLPGSFCVVSGFALLAFYVSLATGSSGRVFHITTDLLGDMCKGNEVEMFPIDQVP